ncbi:hypothetical protein IJF86_02020 [Candidatus Saccharibacteria bacterium]|nr:hypothetical protein [Candidatus Saccharibacteria bacterium]
MQEDLPSQTNIQPEKPTQKKPSHIGKKTYALRFILSLVFGNIFLGCLLGAITTTIPAIIGGDDSTISSYMGPFYAGLITAVIVFGALHIILALSTKRAANEPPKTWQNVLSIIYSSIWSLVGLFYLWMIISTIVGVALGLSDTENLEVIEQIVVGISALVIILVVVAEQMRLISKLPRLFYTWFMTIVSIATIAAFLIFPAAKVRDAAYDEKVESDLYAISNAIEDYADDHYTLPQNLYSVQNSLAKELNFSLGNYTYSTTGRNTYKLCADFKTKTRSSSIYTNSYTSFYDHDKGHVCFDKKTYSYSRYDIRDDVDYDTTENNDNA